MTHREGTHSTPWMRATLALFVAAAMSGTVLYGQAPPRASGAPSTSASSTIPRTPWGDPDLQGTYTNSSESGIPMQRPPQLAGRRLEDITPQELEQFIAERAARAERTAQTIGGTADNDTGAGPPHWYENYNARNSRAWMISDPPDGQIPATTEEARQRGGAVRAARRGGDGYYRGPFDSARDFTLYVRCITRGVPGSMMPAIYGNSYDITQAPGYVAIRYEMVHETRIIPLDNRPRLSDAHRHYMGAARLVGRRHARRGDDQFPRGRRLQRRLRAAPHHRALPPGVARPHRVVDHAGRRLDVGAPLDLRHAAHQRRLAAGARVRVS
jgi:hypothetical protein